MPTLSNITQLRTFEDSTYSYLNYNFVAKIMSKTEFQTLLVAGSRAENGSLRLALDPYDPLNI
jgi:hypothetical protein